MTEKFLEKTARYLLEQHPDNLHTICVVLPGRRATLYLKKYLSRIAGKVILSPDIFSVEEFISRISGYTFDDQLSLLFELYRIHSEMMETEAGDLGDFLPFGRMLLDDFNDIDMNMVDARSLFNYLSEARAIERWNPANHELTDASLKYLKFYRSLYQYYLRLQSNTLKTGKTYKGLVFRYVAENIDVLLSDLPWPKVYFVGFHALTSSEKIITGKFCDSGKGQMLFDSDSYYLHNYHHEAGYHFRKDFVNHQKRFSFLWEGDYFRSIRKNIYVVGVPGNYGQTQYAADQISQWFKQDDSSNDPLSECAVVLVDENFLFPLLNNLPVEIPPFNVTMGYPLRHSLSALLFNQILRLYENARRFSFVDDPKHTRGFYYMDIAVICRHPFLSQLPIFQSIQSHLTQTAKVFYPKEHLLQHINSPDNSLEFLIADGIFGEELPDSVALTKKFERLISLLSQGIEQGENYLSINEFEAGMLGAFLKLFRQLGDLIERYRIQTDIFTFKKVFRQMVVSTTFPFTGEPLQGLQVMGLLETRTLDFRKVIVLSANEGVLPSGPSVNTLIPFDIRREFALPGTFEKNAVTAYHFYRLLQRAEEIHLVYNTEPDDLGGGEPSRYLLQLEHELTNYQPDHFINRRIISYPLPEISSETSIIIPKTPQIMETLEHLAKTGLSTTTLNSYRKCPLLFYFNHILKLGELSEVEESIEAKTLGTIVHEILENLYKPFINQPLSPGNFDSMKQSLNDTVRHAIEKNYTSADTDYGWNRLLREVIRNFAFHWIEVEQKVVTELVTRNSSIEIIDLEKTFEYLFEITIPISRQIRLRGTIDRIDRIDNTIRIIDYKTGRVENFELSFDSWESLVNSPKNEKAFQVLMYAWLFLKNNGQNVKMLKSGLVSLRKPNNGFIELTLKDQPDFLTDISFIKEYIKRFESWLTEILSSLFDETLPFVQTDDRKNCRICDYREICIRS